MKKLLSLLLSAVMVSSVMPVNSVTVLAAEKGDVKEFHVSTKGTDVGTGAIDDPIDTLANAKAAVAEFKKINPKVPVEVIFHEGDYRFTDVVKFTSADSGTEEGPITYKAAEGEEVKFKGSKEIDTSKIQVVSDAETLAKLPATSRGKVGYIDLAAQGLSDVAEIVYTLNTGYTCVGESELFLNGNKQILSRWPNGIHGFDKYETVVSAGSTGAPGQGVGGIFTTKDFRLMNWENAKDAWAVGFWGCDYYYERVKIAEIDVASKQVKLASSSVYGLKTGYSCRYAIINLLEELDAPGEYYIDHDTKILYYYPERTLLGATMEITTLGTDLVELNGVSNINFEGITFTQTRANAIRLGTTPTNINITNCTFDNIGKYAIYQTVGTRSTVAQNTPQVSQFSETGAVNFHVNNNVFTNIGHRAIEMYCGARDANEISNCSFNNNYLYNIGTVFVASYGMQIYGVGVEIAYNTVHYSGYGIGWVGADFDIHHNEIYNTMNQLSDGSAIYTGRNFINRNNKVHHNYIHDTTAKSEFINSDLCAGIYLDDMDSGTEVYQNIVKDAHIGIINNCGMSNNIHDNITVDTPREPIYMSTFQMGDANSRNRQETEGYQALELAGYDRYPDIREDLESGLVSYPARNTVEGNLAVRGTIGYSDLIMGYNEIENNHMVGDEEFVDPENGDYRLKNSSKYAELTDNLTEDFDMATIGLQQDEFGETPMLKEGFKLTSPANGTRGIQSESITFNWQRPVGADRFTVKIATDSRMENIIKEIDTYESTVTIDGFEKGQTYYWRVYAKNESTIASEGIASLGVPHMFTIANQFKADTSDLQALIISGRDKLTKIIEGDAIGEYKVGTKQALTEKLELAEKMVKYGGYSEADQKQAVEDIDDLINSDTFINGGFKDLGDFMADTENWEVREADNYSIDPTSKTIKVDAYDKTINVLTYKGVEDYSRVLALSFKLKIDFGDGDNSNRWLGIGLRGTAANQPCYQSGNDQYFITMKQGLIEYQRNSGGTNQILEVVEDASIKNNEWMDIDFGVVNLGDVGQLTIIKINGRVAYQAVDSSDNMVMKKGFFQIMPCNKMGIEIKAADRELESFDELVDEYTLKMTKDFCTELESYNSTKGTIIRSGSPMAYYNGDIHSISQAPVGEGSSMMISTELAAIAFGGTISGNNIIIDGVSYQLPAKNSDGMVNLQELAKTVGHVAYLYSDMQLVFISKSLDMHVANYFKQFKGASDSLALYIN